MKTNVITGSRWSCRHRDFGDRRGEKSGGACRGRHPLTGVRSRHRFYDRSRTIRVRRWCRRFDRGVGGRWVTHCRPGQRVGVGAEGVPGNGVVPAGAGVWEGVAGERPRARPAASAISSRVRLPSAASSTR